MDFTIYGLNAVIPCLPSTLINFASYPDNVYCLMDDHRFKQETRIAQRHSRHPIR